MTKIVKLESNDDYLRLQILDGIENLDAESLRVVLTVVQGIHEDEIYEERKRRKAESFQKKHAAWSKRFIKWLQPHFKANRGKSRQIAFKKLQKQYEQETGDTAPCLKN